MTLQELRSRRNALLDRQAAMLTASEVEGAEPLDVTAYDAITAEVDNANAQISRHELLDAQRAALAVPVPAAAAAAVPGEPAPANVIPASAVIQASTEPRDFENLGEFLYSAAYRHGDPRLNYVEMEAAGQSMGTGSEGGFMVPTQFLPEILRIEPAETPLLSAARTIEAGSPPDAEISMPALDQTGAAPDNQFGGVKTAWLGEGALKASTEAKLAEVKWKPQEVAGFISVTEKLLRNWVAATTFLTELLRGGLNSAIEFALFTGDGIAKPLGIINSVAVIKVARETANTVTFQDLSRMKGKMLMRGRAAFWLITQELMEDILQLKNDNNNLIFVADSAVAGPAGMLMGLPIFWYEHANARGTLGDITLVQPDPYYIVKNGSGPFVAIGQSGDDFERNKQKIKIFTNVDGQAWLRAPHKLANGYEVSPFVLLDVPAA